MNTYITILDERKVNQLFHECLLGNEEERIKVEGISRIEHFSAHHIDDNHQIISEMLDALHDDLKTEGGGGASFLVIGYDKDGEPWTDSLFIQEQLLMLGIAIGRVKIPLPKTLWYTYQDSMPDIIIS